MATTVTTVAAVKAPPVHQKVTLVSKDLPPVSVVAVKPPAVAAAPAPQVAGSTPPVIAATPSKATGIPKKNYRVTVGVLSVLVSADSPDHAWASFAAYHGIVGSEAQAEIYEV